MVPGWIPLEGMFFSKRNTIRCLGTIFWVTFTSQQENQVLSALSLNGSDFFVLRGMFLPDPKCSKIQGDERERHGFMPALNFPHR